MPSPHHPTAKFKRAKVRHMLFASGPNRLFGGRIFKKHFDQSITLNEIDIQTPSWPKAFDGLRVGHVSDFHLGCLMPIDRAIDAIAMLASQKPDLVVCTGDVVDLHAEGALPLLSSLANINAPLGTMLVLGNHDELDSAATLSSMAYEVGMTVLRDTHCHLKINGATLNIAGVNWAKNTKRCSQKVQAVCNTHTHLLLSHNPKSFDAASQLKIPLTLAGHTHGGQMAMPHRKEANLAVTHRYSAGLYEQGDSRLFVTVGVGAWFPLRINCPAEVALLTVKSA